MDWSPEDDIPGRLLHQAALWDNVDLLEDLLKGDQSAMINSQDSWGRTPLHAAAITEDSRCLRILLQAGADPNSKCGPRADNCTALHMSVAHGHAGNVECLLEFGANFIDRDIAGMTALDIAERQGDTKCINLLKNASDERDRWSQELRCAVSRGDAEAARALLQQLGPEAQAVVNAAPGGTNTLLFAACQLGRSALVSLLLQHGADGRAHPVTGYTPLYTACHQGHARAAEIVLEKYPELVQQATMEKWLPVHAACINGHADVVRLLLRYEYPSHLLSAYSDSAGRWQWHLAFDPDAQDVTGQTPLYMASLLGNKKLVELLLAWRVPATRVQERSEDSPASITPTPSPGSPAKRRISEGIQSIMSKLSLGSSQQQESPHERLVSPLRLNLVCGAARETALLAAARGGHQEVVAALLVAGADPNLASNSASASNTAPAEESGTVGIGGGGQSCCSSTALAEAVRLRSLPMVELLLRHGARDDRGDAVAAAAVNQDEQIVARLLATKAYPDPEYKINKKALGSRHVGGEAGGGFPTADAARSTNLTYSSLFPNTPTMLNWHDQRCHLSNIRPQWLSAAALHCNPRLKGHPKGSELSLGALTRIDLSTNSLVSLPAVVFQLCSLRYLNVAQNKIERLPVPSDSATKRRSSKKDPAKLDFGCQVLEELYLQDNRLDELPEALFRLPSLVTLDVSNNKLRALPFAMWRAPALRELSVAFNLLRELPVQDEMAADSEMDNISVSSSDSRLSLSECSNSEPTDTICKRKHWAVSQSELHRHHIWSRCLEITEQVLHCEDNVTECSSQLSSLNLAHNLFSSLPAALPCLAVNLTRLNLSYNSLRSMSHITSYPASLKQLDLSHNQITCWPSLPQIEACDSMEMAHITCYSTQDGAAVRSKAAAAGNRNSRSLRSCILQSVCAHRRHLRLEALRTLVLADNLLSRIQLSTDDDAGVAYDEDDSDWSVVNATKARLVFPNLSMLDISNNSLKEIPSSIHELSNLSVLNISGNIDICELPPHMGLLSRLWNLNTRGCSLQEPLRSMTESKKYKTMHIIGYLKSILEDARPYARMKLMIVGIQGIGKTSLLEQLRQEGTPHYRKKPADHWAKRMGHKHINQKTHRGTNMSTVGVDIGDWVFEKKVRGQSAHGPVVFRTWDFGGQKEYYATHQYFLSRRSLYLVVWRITDGRRGLDEILQWLVNIQARAPNSPVLIVGTHYDAVGESYPAPLSEELQQTIRERFINVADAEKLGLPRVLDTIEVSCRTRHNIRLLCGLIYDTVFSLRPPGSKELLLEQRVPACYLALEECVAALAGRLRGGGGGEPVVRGADRYRAMVAQEMSARGHRAFRDAAELAQATMFLHDNGVLLHYDDATLKDLYFLDPQWLCDVLAHVVTIREINPFARTGIMRLDDLAHVFHGARAPLLTGGADGVVGGGGGHGYVVSLLNKFEVALTWDSRTLLIPSLLPLTEEDQNPGEAVTVKIALRSKGWAVRSKKLSPMEMPFVLGSPSAPSEPSRPVHELTHRQQPDKSITRLLLMSYFPSGFWSRLITRILADDAVVDVVRGFFILPPEISHDAALTKALDVKAEWSLWQTGLRLRYGNITIFKMREVLSTTPAPYKHLRFRVKQEGVWCDLDMQNSSILEIHFPVHDLVIRRVLDEQERPESAGGDVTVAPCMRATSQLLSLAVDHIDILLEDWYPTLGTRFVHTSEGRFLVTRIVPCPKCLLCIPGNQPNPLDGPSGSTNSLQDRLSKALTDAASNQAGAGPGAPASRKSQDSLLGWSDGDGDSGVGQSGGSSRAASVEGHPCLLQQHMTAAEMAAPPLNYSWMVEECILAAYDRKAVACPAHGDIGLDAVAPDTIFMDLSPKHSIQAGDITRGPLLGRGAFGFVFRAQYRRGGGGGATARVVEVAMKMLQPVQPGPRARQSAHIAYKAAQGKWERDPLQYACKAYCTARQELNILLNLSHPNIVPLVGVCLRPLALVLDLAPRGALDAALRDLRRSGARVLPRCLRALVLQAARALEYLHGRRVIYRDLKAENVLVWRLPPPGVDASSEDEVHIKLADYGISRLTLPSGAKGFGGTEGFMAPEMARYNGEEEYTEKVDCFSFGMLLYELITLRQPFEGHEAVKECVLEGGRPPLTHREVQCPSYCLDLMSLCWSQQPADRPSASQIVSVASAPEFAHLLDVASLDHQAAVCAAAAVQDQDEPGQWDMWMLCANRRVDMLRGSARGWTASHHMGGCGGTGGTHQPQPRPTATCVLGGGAVWIGDSHGRIHAYDASDCTPLFTYALESAPELESLSSSAVSCLLPLPTAAPEKDGASRVACSLAGGRLFLVDGGAPPRGPTHGEGTFVLTELGPGRPVHSLAAVGCDTDGSACELWCGLSGGAIAVFTLRGDSVCGHETVDHLPEGACSRRPESPDTGVHVARTRSVTAATGAGTEALAVTQLQACGSRVWSYVYPGCVVYQWDYETRCIENRLDCSKLVPCSESLKSISIEEHLNPGRCQVTSMCVLGDEIYIGTIWGCIIVAEMESLRPITIFRPYEEEVRAIVPLCPRGPGELDGCPLVATVGRGYRNLIERYTDQHVSLPCSPAGTPGARGGTPGAACDADRCDNMHALLWRAQHWAVA